MKGAPSLECRACNVVLPMERHQGVRYCDPCRAARRKVRVLHRNAAGEHICLSCNGLMDGRMKAAKYCWSCAALRQRRQSIAAVLKNNALPAYSLMRAAIRYGFLAHPKNFKCVDCGGAANCYDHRDYNKPLDVDPVCTGCNVRRGRGIPFVPVADAFLDAPIPQQAAA